MVKNRRGRRRYPDHRIDANLAARAIICRGVRAQLEETTPASLTACARVAEPAAALQSAPHKPVGCRWSAPTGRTAPPRGRMGCATRTMSQGQAECRFHRSTSPPPPPPREPGHRISIQFILGLPATTRHPRLCRLASANGGRQGPGLWSKAPTIARAF